MTRRNVLLGIVLGLGGLLAFRLLLTGERNEAPPHPRLTGEPMPSVPASGMDARKVPESGASATPEPRFSEDELDLLQLGARRSGDAPAGARYVGTNDPQAAARCRDARAAWDAKDPVRTAALAREGLAFDPTYPQLLVLAASAELAQSDEHLAEAERLARRAEAASYCYAEAHYALACSLARQNRPAEAAAALRLAIQWARERGLDAAAEARGESDFDRVRHSAEIIDVLGPP